MRNEKITTEQFNEVQSLIQEEVFGNIYAYDDCHDGSSYDGFWSQCEGWNKWMIPIDLVDEFVFDDSVEPSTYEETMREIEREYRYREFCQQDVSNVIEWLYDKDMLYKDLLVMYWKNKQKWYYTIDCEEFCKKYTTLEEFLYECQFGSVDLSDIWNWCEEVDLDSVWDEIGEDSAEEYMSENSRGFDNSDYPAHLVYGIVCHDDHATAYAAINTDYGYCRDKGDKEVKRVEFDYTDFNDYKEKALNAVRELWDAVKFER